MNQEEYEQRAGELGDEAESYIIHACRIIKTSIACSVVSAGLLCGGLGILVYRNYLESNLPPAAPEKRFAQPSLKELNGISGRLIGTGVYSTAFTAALALYAYRKRKQADRKCISLISFLGENRPVENPES